MHREAKTGGQSTLISIEQCYCSWVYLHMKASLAHSMRIYGERERVSLKNF